MSVPMQSCARSRGAWSLMPAHVDKQGLGRPLMQDRPVGTGETGVLSSEAARLRCRAGELTRHTAGQAPGYVQGNLCILPKAYAMDFAAFCQRNPKPCPVIGMSAVGDPTLPD